MQLHDSIKSIQLPTKLKLRRNVLKFAFPIHIFQFMFSRRFIFRFFFVRFVFKLKIRFLFHCHKCFFFLYAMCRFDCVNSTPTPLLLFSYGSALFFPQNTLFCYVCVTFSWFVSVWHVLFVQGTARYNTGEVSLFHSWLLRWINYVHSLDI